MRKATFVRKYYGRGYDAQSTLCARIGRKATRLSHGNTAVNKHG